MKRIMNLMTLFGLFMTVVLYLCSRKRDSDILFSALITFGTITYHFVMRLLVGLIVNQLMHNHTDYHRWWFRQRPFEEALYQKLQVKKWKDRMPTYRPDYFSLKRRSPEEIIQAMCQAEIVHEVIAALSLLPILATVWFGAFPVFLITSAAAAWADLMFAMLQRYNRPRMIRAAEKGRERLLKNMT